MGAERQIKAVRKQQRAQPAELAILTLKKADKNTSPVSSDTKDTPRCTGNAGREETARLIADELVAQEQLESETKKAQVRRGALHEFSINVRVFN